MGRKRDAAAGTMLRANATGRLQLQDRADPCRWTPEAQIAFLEHLALSANVHASARAAGVDERGAYRLRLKSPAFREAWAAALNEGYAKLEMMLLERAMNGVTRPIYNGGAKVGVVRSYSDATAIRLLNAHRAAVAVERAAPRSDPAEVARKLDAKLVEIEGRLRAGPLD